MTPSPVIPKLTFEQYLNYDDGTDNYYELEDGELLLMNPPIGLHAIILTVLSNILLNEINRLKLPWIPLQLVGVRTALRRSRLPDLCVVPLEQMQPYLNASAVLEAGVILAIEVVSPDSVKRDYRFKRTEYAAFGIPEYWIIDPLEQKVMVLQLVEGLYEDKEYRGDEALESQIFPELSLTVNQVLQQ
uniref:Putative restriction endonuclease domain-containing protein n=1 Tax=Cyanothece sp. (strain PCC 7425 / ATCC 29141) TaxID=395961 RepID=B8HM48_CYAP4